MRTKVIATRALLLASAALFAGTEARSAAVGDIFYIAMENQNWTQPAPSCAGCPGSPILGNSAAPYINSLVTPGNANAAMVSYASNYTNVPPQLAGSPSGAGVVHPSEPNYVWGEAGLTGARNDADPYGAGINNNTLLLPKTNPNNNVVNAPNFSAQLQNAGKTWKSYQEGTDLATTGGPVNGSNLTNTVLPKNQYTVPLVSFAGTSSTYTNVYNGSHQYNYAAKHNPQIYFAATNGGNNTTTSNPLSMNYAPLEQLSTDLANNTVSKYNWITPDQFNDMHTSLSGGFTYHGVHYTGNQANIAQGDNFLSIIIPMIEASQAFQDNGEIVIWNDETEGDVNAGTTAGFTAMEIVISPLAKGNAYTNTIGYTHSSDLLTNEGFTGMPCLADACNAMPLTDLFVAGTTFDVPEPASLSVLAMGLLGLRIIRRRHTSPAR
jgi:phosphatidylinositol-3-phosphatase